MVVMFCMIGCGTKSGTKISVPAGASVQYGNSLTGAKVAVGAPLANALITKLNAAPDTAEKNVAIDLRTRTYLHVNGMTLQVNGNELLLHDGWGVRTWIIKGIETQLEALMTKAPDKPDAGDEERIGAANAQEKAAGPHAKEATHPAEVARLMKRLPDIPVDGSLEEILAVLGLEDDWTGGGVSSTHCDMVWQIAPGYKLGLSFDPVPGKDASPRLVFVEAGFSAQNKPGFPADEYHTIYPYRTRKGMVSK